MTEDAFFAVVCMNCRGRTPRDINRHAGAQAYFHRRAGGHADCRLLVVPDPDGDDHLVQVVPDDVEAIAFRNECLRASEEVRSRHRKCLALGIQAVA